MSFSEWKKYKLDEFCEPIRNGYTPKSSEDLAYVGLEHIEQQTLRLLSIGQSSDVTSNKFKFESGDVLFGKLRPYFRKVYRPKFSGICSTDISVFRAKKNFDTGYLFYLIATKDFIDYSNAVSSGTRMPRADWNLLKNSEWSIPDLKTQQRIASILSSLDDAIELNQQINKTLEEMAKAIFKEWFVDFNFPNTTGKFQETEIGKIPVGWKVGKLSEVCEVNKNTLNKKNDLLEWIDYIEISEVSRGQIGNVTRYNLGDEPSRAKRKLKHGDTVLSTVRPDRGSYFLAINPSQTDIASTGFAVFTPTKVPFSFLNLFLTDEINLKYYGQVANGGAYPAINSNTIMEMDLIIPDVKTLKAFHKIVEPMFLQVQQIIEENHSLSNLRDTLLPKLMKGEIEIV